MDTEVISNGAPQGEASTSAVAKGTDQSKPGAEKKAGGDPAGGIQQKAETPAERKLRVKFGKQERELTETEVVAMAQKGWASDQRFQDAAKLRKEVEDFWERADLDKIVEKKTGKNAIEYYKDKLKAELRRATMSPQERAEAEAQSRVEKLKQEESEILTRREQEKMSKLEASYSEQYDRELTDAIVAEGLPKNRHSIGRAVEIAKKVVDAGLDPNWTAIVREAKRQMQDDYKELFEAIKDDDSLLSLLGENLPRRISKALVGKGQPKLKAVAVEQKNRDNFRPEEDKKPMDLDAWLEKRKSEFK